MVDAKKIVTQFDASDTEAREISINHAEVVCFSNRSPTKETSNEDASAIIPVDDETTVLVIADGMGGMPAGDQASEIVIKCLIDTLKNNGVQTRESILKGIDNANKKIINMKKGAGSTVSVAEVKKNKIRSYHVGDSLILATTNHGNVKFQTISHSPIGYALVNDAIDQKQAMRHPERNLIYNYVGSDDMNINIGPIIKLSPYDTLLLSSDAVSDNMYENEICEFISKGSLVEGVTKLIKGCNRNMIETLPDRLCHPDDLTLIGFRLK